MALPELQKLQQELVLVLDKAGMPKEVVNYVSTTVEKNAEDKNRKQVFILAVSIYQFIITANCLADRLEFSFT